MKKSNIWATIQNLFVIVSFVWLWLFDVEVTNTKLLCFIFMAYLALRYKLDG